MLIYGLLLLVGYVMWMGSVFIGVLALAAAVAYAWLNWLVAGSLRHGTRFRLCVAVSLSNMLITPRSLPDTLAMLGVALGGFTLLALVRSRRADPNEESPPGPEDTATEAIR